MSTFFHLVMTQLYLIYFQLSLEATAAACDVSSPPVVTSGNRNGSIINGHNGTNGFEDITSVPSLAADLRYLRPKKFTIKGIRIY